MDMAILKVSSLSKLHRQVIFVITNIIKIIEIQLKKRNSLLFLDGTYFWSSCNLVLMNQIGFVNVHAVKPAQLAARICTIGDSGVK